MNSSLKRHVGLFALTLFGIGDILGAGVYGLVGKAAGEMGNAIWLAFFVSMLAAGLTGLSYASLGSRYPHAGGASYVTHRAYGSSFLSYVVGLAVLASGLTSMATACHVFSGYLTGFLPFLPHKVVLFGFAFAIAFLVYWGIREALWANSVFTVIELSGLLVVLAVGASYLGSVDLLSTVTPARPEGGITLGLMLGGSVLTFYSFIGFEDMLNVAEEVVEPHRTLPRALLIAIGVSSLVYMGVSFVAVSVIPAAELAQSKQPLVDVVARAAPSFPVGIFSLVALFAVANTALLNFVMGSRLIYGMSNQKLLPAFLGHVDKHRSSPARAILAVLAILVALIFVGNVASLAKATSVLLLMCFTFVNVALFVLQGRKDEPKGLEIPRFVPIAGATVCVAMLSRAKTPELILAGTVLAVISALYFFLKPSAAALKSMET